MKLIVDKADSFSSKPVLPAESLDLGLTLHILVRFVHQASNNDQGWRIKTKLCILIDAVMSKRDYFPLRKDNHTRNLMVDTSAVGTHNRSPFVIILAFYCFFGL